MFKWLKYLCPVRIPFTEVAVRKRYLHKGYEVLLCIRDERIDNSSCFAYMHICYTDTIPQTETFISKMVNKEVKL